MRKVFERYLTESEERSLFGCIQQYGDVLARRDAAWMTAMRQTGVRVAAFSQLTIFDAREALRTGHLQLRSCIQKRRQAHTVFLNRKAAAALRRLLTIRRELGHVEKPDEPLVMSRKHRALSVRSYQARMRLWCRRAGLDVQASPHWFRHTLAKRIIARSEARDPLGIVQGALGHISRNSTGVYALPDREEIRQAMEQAS